MSCFAKHAPDAPAGFLSTEAAGLAWLREANGAAVVRVLGLTEQTLTLERLSSVRPTPADAERFGHALAQTHMAGAPAFGAPPPQAPLDHGFFGPTHEPLRLSYAHAPTWGAFFADERLMPFARTAFDRGQLATLTPFEQLADRLHHGQFDDDLPAARLHGDLWSGNVVWTLEGAVLIDPAAHGGHPLSDIALMTLFGMPHLERIIAAYQDAVTLPDDWRTLIDLHQLPCLLLHAAVFGSVYGAQSLQLAKRYL